MFRVRIALRGAATLKARTLKEVWNIAAVIPVDKPGGSTTHGGGGGGGGGSNHGSNHGSSNGSNLSGELVHEDNFLGICSRELLARGCELLKRTRKGIIFYLNHYNCNVLKIRFSQFMFNGGDYLDDYR